MLKNIGISLGIAVLVGLVTFLVGKMLDMSGIFG